MGFAKTLISWQKQHGRHDLPWQDTRDPYPIWVSEIMLQQTQVATVIPYYNRFMERFPDIATLAKASEDEVLALWAGLGYYARGRNLHRAARQIVEQHAGVFPSSLEAIRALPGIGRSTAAAIAAFAFGTRGAILDGNVKRVLTRAFAIDGWPGSRKVEMQLWQLATDLLPEHEIDVYTQALMDLGATICTRTHPRCGICPVSSSCRALAMGQVNRFPVSRPRKAMSEKHAQLLVIRHGPDVLLEKRPSSGIWGGLWSLPQIEMHVDPATTCLGLTGFPPLKIQPLPAFTHTLTHLRLHILPQEIQLGQHPLCKGGHLEKPSRAARVQGARRAATEICQADRRGSEHRAMPQSGRTAGFSRYPGESGYMWQPIEDALHAALPKPVLRILKTLCLPDSSITLC